MSKGFERAAIIILCLILGIMAYLGLSLNSHVDKVKSDIKTLRALLSSIPKPMMCPEPGQPTNKLCHYRLEIQGPLEKHTGWFVAQVPKEVVEKAKTDCEGAKAKNPDMGDHTCVDPATYTYRDYAIQVDGTVSDKAVYDFVNDPVTGHLMVYTTKQ